MASAPKRYGDDESGGGGHDRVRRADKEAAVTAPPAPLVARAGGVCGPGLKLCPNSLGGGCCPGDYDCAPDSCYAAATSPSTCGTLVGWFACAQVYGGGCCPQGYLCQRGANCAPPSGSPYSNGCPSSHYMCPASMSYGCCPDGMACAVNQCYAAGSTTLTATSTLTAGGTVYTTTRTAVVETPDVPTGLSAMMVGESGEDQKVLKYYPTAVAKTSRTGDAVPQDAGGVPPAQLGGIVVGSVSFAALLLVAGFFVARRLGVCRGRGGGDSRRASGSARAAKTRTSGGGGGSDSDAMSLDPLMIMTATPTPLRPEPSSSPSPAIYSRRGAAGAGPNPNPTATATATPNPGDPNPQLDPDPHPKPGRATPTSCGGGFSSVGPGPARNNRQASQYDCGDSAAEPTGFLDPQQPGPAPSERTVSCSGVARTVSRLTLDSRPLCYHHGRTVSDVSDLASMLADPDRGFSVASMDAAAAAAAVPATPKLVVELDAQPHVAELPAPWPTTGSPVSTTAASSPTDPYSFYQLQRQLHDFERWRPGGGSGGGGSGTVTATTAHQRSRNDGRADVERLGVVDEEMPVQHGPGSDDNK